MRGERVLLDTDIVASHLRDANRLTSRLKQNTIFLSDISLTELYAGAFKSRRPDARRSLIEKFPPAVQRLSIDRETLVVYGRTWARLSAAGRMIPRNDIWIAALALQRDLPLVGHDSHFGNVDGLKVWRW